NTCESSVWNDLNFVYRCFCGIIKQYFIKHRPSDDYGGIRCITCKGAMGNDELYACQRNFNSSKCLFNSKIFKSKNISNCNVIIYFRNIYCDDFSKLFYFSARENVTSKRFRNDDATFNEYYFDCISN